LIAEKWIVAPTISQTVKSRPLRPGNSTTVSKPARISELVDALDMMSDEWSGYLDRETGRVIVLLSDWIDAAESDEEEKWDSVAERWGIDEPGAEQMALARAIAGGTDSKRYLPLPDKFDFHEDRNIQDFIRTLPQDRIQDDLWDAIRGKGAFRRFKDKAERHGIINAWYAYRDDAIRRHMTEWAEANGIVLEEGPSRPW
jgi:hypothetical protein